MIECTYSAEHKGHLMQEVETGSPSNLMAVIYDANLVAFVESNEFAEAFSGFCEELEAELEEIEDAEDAEENCDLDLESDLDEGDLSANYD